MNRKAVLLAFSAAVLSAPSGFAVDYPNTMDGKAAIACAFEADLVFARRIEMADKYVTANFTEHNPRARTSDIATFRDALSKMPKFPGPASGCGGAKIVLQQGDYVVFVRETMVPDPQDSTKRVPGSHFDVFRFEGNKIAEHWD